VASPEFLPAFQSFLSDPFSFVGAYQKRTPKYHETILYGSVFGYFHPRANCGTQEIEDDSVTARLTAEPEFWVARWFLGLENFLV